MLFIEWFHGAFWGAPVSVHCLAGSRSSW